MSRRRREPTPSRIAHRTASGEGRASHRASDRLHSVWPLGLAGAGFGVTLWQRSGHSLQLPKRIKRSQRDEFEAHQVRLAERQLLEHVVSGS
jgi:hypothetical protein